MAEAIVSLAERPRRERVIGQSGRTLRVARLLAPSLQERMFARQVERDHFQDAPAPATEGNVFEPMVFEPMAEGTGVSGRWRSRGAARLRPLALAAGVALVPALVAGARLRR